MRNIIAVEFLSLDGVIQGPGGPDEDTTNGFKYGGWFFPFSDETVGESLGLTYGQPYDLLLGRFTYNIFAGYWPKVLEDAKTKKIDEGNLKFAEEFNACTKYVATHSPDTLKWQNTQPLGSDIIQSVEKIKSTDGKNLLVVGSSQLVHQLLAHGLIDELHLHISPVVLGKGKRLFDETSKPGTLKLIRSAISKSGVLVMNYAKAGEVKTGSFEP